MKQFLIGLILIAIFFTFKQQNNDELVFYELDYSYENFIITFENNNISTNNILAYFPDIKIIWIEPYINNLYKEKFKDNTKYNFDYISNKKNIEKFSNIYISKLEMYGYTQDALDLKIDGIKIKKMMIYCSYEDLTKLKTNINGLIIE